MKIFGTVFSYEYYPASDDTMLYQYQGIVEMRVDPELWLDIEDSETIHPMSITLAVSDLTSPCSPTKHD